jgi:hypothetical protein
MAATPRRISRAGIGYDYGCCRVNRRAAAAMFKRSRRRSAPKHAQSWNCAISVSTLPENRCAD